MGAEAAAGSVGASMGEMLGASAETFASGASEADEGGEAAGAEIEGAEIEGAEIMGAEIMGADAAGALIKGCCRGTDCGRDLAGDAGAGAGASLPDTRITAPWHSAALFRNSISNL